MTRARPQPTDDATLAELLRQGLVELALDCPPTQQASLLRYLDLLVRWNKVYNLTAVDNPREMVIKHLLDSLAVLPCLTKGRILDVGSGAGLPAVPIALVQPSRLVTALDSSQKKVRFITQAILELGISNLSAIHHRVEDYQPMVRYDVVIARAYASIADFITATAHLLIPGGRWFAMKGVYPTAELDALPDVCTLVEVIPLHVPRLSAERHLVVLHHKGLS